jgi:hypothetical protein
MLMTPGATTGLPSSGSTTAGLPLLNHAAAAELDGASREGCSPMQGFV